MFKKMIFSRWQRIFRRSLFVLLPLSLGIFLYEALPQEPRWSVPTPVLGAIHFTPDGQCVLTAHFNESTGGPSGPLILRDLSTGEARHHRFENAYQLSFFGFIPDTASDMVLNVKQNEVEPWRAFVLDCGTGRVRPRTADLPAAKDENLYILPHSHFGLSFQQNREHIDDFDVSLIDLKEDRVALFWRAQTSLDRWSFRGNLLFFARKQDDKWMGQFWNTQNYELSAETDAADSMWISPDKRWVLASNPLCAGHQRVKIWDLKSAQLRADLVMEDGYVLVSEDLRWAILQPPHHVMIDMIAGDVTPPVKKAVWDLQNDRRAGSFWAKASSFFHFQTVDGRPCILSWCISTSEYPSKSLLSLRDAESLELHWERLWAERPSPVLQPKLKSNVFLLQDGVLFKKL